MGKRKCKLADPYHSIQILTQSPPTVGVKADKVSVLQTPHYEGLTVERFVDEIEEKPQVRDYFPEKREEIERLPRSWIINVLYTLEGTKFKDAIK